MILGTSDCSIVVVDESGPEDQLLTDRLPSPITKMALAPSGRFAACYRSDGIVTVLSSTFTQKILDFDTRSQVRAPFCVLMSVTMCGPLCSSIPYELPPCPPTAC